MNKTITTADARKNFAEIVNTVAYGKEPGENISAGQFWKQHIWNKIRILA